MPDLAPVFCIRCRLHGTAGRQHCLQFGFLGQVMELKKVYVIGAKLLEAVGDMFGRFSSGSFQRFGGDDNPVAHALQCLPDFSLTVHIHVCGIEKVDAAIETIPDHFSAVVCIQLHNGDPAETEFRNHEPGLA